MTMDRLPLLTRRQAVSSLLAGSLLLPGLGRGGGGGLWAGETPAPTDPLAPRAPHFPAKAKRVIMIYLSGGMSHVDSFDYKPKLYSAAGTKANGKWIKRPDWEFKPRGKCGAQISEMWPHLAEKADELCIINSLKADHGNHFEATLGIHTGSVTVARPSMGAWVSYALGTYDKNLPSFVVLAPELPYAGGQVWSANFLPPCHQGVRITPGDEPIPDIIRRLPTAELQGLELGLVQSLNQRHLQGRPDQALSGRMDAFTTAGGMQNEAPEVFDLSKESDATHELYGLKRGDKKGFAWQALVARRLAERGVRFIELIDVGANSGHNWDAHGDMATHTPLAKNVDQPTAALLTDLRQRGMLDDTLVIFTTEFGRTPTVDGEHNKGREHHPNCFTSWLAGGGVKPGMTYGASDELGVEVAEKLVHVNDFHATILHLLGLDHEKLTFRYGGRDFRLTDVAGNVVKDIIA
jgi:hypothetical protein